MEVNYDENPTPLYVLIEKRKSEEVIQHCLGNPDEASTWIVKKDGGKIRWRLLPLHVALMIRVSDEAIKTIIKTYKEGVKNVDDQGRLPIHLALRHIAHESIIDELLQIYPDGMEVKDSKGRVPIEMINDNPSSPKAKKGHHLRLFAAKLYRKLKSKNSEDSSLQQQLDDAKRKLANLGDGDLDPDVVALKDNIQELESLLKSSTENHDRVVAMFEKRKTLHDNEKKFLSSQLKSAEEENETLLKMNKLAQDENTKELSIMLKKQQDLRMKIAEKKNKVVEQAQQINSLKEELAKTKDEIVSLQSGLEIIDGGYKNKVSGLNQELENLKKDKEKSEAKRASESNNLEGLLNNEKEKYGKIRDRVQRERMENEEMRTEIKELREKLALFDIFQKSIHSSEKKFSSLSNSVIELKSNLETSKDVYKESIKELESNLETNKDIYSTTIQDLKLKLDAHDQDFKRLQMEVEMLETEKNAYENKQIMLEEEIISLQNAKNSAENYLKAEEQKSQSFVKIIESLKVQISETRDQVTTQIKIRQIEKEETGGMIQLLKEQVANLNEEIKRTGTEGTIPVLKKQILALKEENELKDTKLDEYQKELSARMWNASDDTQISEKRVTELQIECTEMSRQNRQLQRKLIDLFSDCDGLKDVFEEKERQQNDVIDNLRLDLNECEDEIDNYKSQIEDLTRKLKLLTPKEK